MRVTGSLTFAIGCGIVGLVLASWVGDIITIYGALIVLVVGAVFAGIELRRWWRSPKSSNPMCCGLGIHGDTDMLVAIVTGQHDEPGQVLDILEHVDICEDCQARLTVLVALRASIGRPIIRRELHDLGQ